MRRQWRWCFVLLFLAATGCSSGDPVVDVAPPEPPPPQPAPPPPPLTLGDHIDISLTSLLEKPRAELAQMADDLLAAIRRQEYAYTEGRIEYHLAPTLRFALTVPVFQDSKFSAKLGFSRPPYFNEQEKDAA